MNRRTSLIMATLIVAIVVAAVGSFMFSFKTPTKGTYIEVSPAGIAVESGNGVSFVAALFSGGTELMGMTISWSVTQGHLNATSGTTVTFTAPNVTASTTVNVTASFAGQGAFQPNSTTVAVTVTPVEATTTTLEISPSAFEVNCGGTIALNVTLLGASNSTLTGKTIMWSISPSGAGNLSSATGASVTYTAPDVTGNTTVTIVASFGGDGQYAASSDSVRGTICATGQPSKQLTLVVVTPSNFSIQSNETQVLNAILTDGSGNVLKGKTVTWSISPSGTGSLSSGSGSSVNYTAPAVAGNTTVTIVAEFGGDDQYAASSASAQGTVTPHVGVRMVTFLRIEPTEFSMYSNGTQVFSATLTDASGNVLVGKTITWKLVFGCPTCGYGVGGGDLNSSVGTTVTYHAISVITTFILDVQASFAGDYYYQGSQNASVGSVNPQAGTKGSTSLKISPSSFAIPSNGTVVLNATLTDALGNYPEGKTITWSVSPSGAGSLSSATGTDVTYTAPSVSANTTVTITASFAGDDFYLGSNGSVTGTIMPVVAASNLYVVTFTSAQMTNVKFQGPVVVGGQIVTNITCDHADLSDFTLNHLGLNASAMNASSVELDVTYFSAFSLDSGSAVTMVGGQAEALGPLASARYANGIIYLVRMAGSEMNLTQMVAVGEDSSGSEPYIPSILSAQSAGLMGVTGITGPVNYTDAAVRVSNITVAAVTMAPFSFVHPVSYTLDRSSRTCSYENRWVLNSTGATATDLTVYTIYLKAIVHDIYLVTATGSDDITGMIPHSFYGNCALLVTSLQEHTVYFSAAELTLDSVTLSVV